MRILVISNLYPPYYLGGYEFACAGIVEALRGRGHQIKVLTSWRGLSLPKIESGTLRLLKVRLCFEPPFKNRLTEFCWYLWNWFVLRLIAKKLKPEVIYVFNVSGLGGLILNWLHTQSRPVVHGVGDTWLIEAYKDDVWFGLSKKNPRSKSRRLIKSMVETMGSIFLDTQPASLNLKISHFWSRFLKERFQEAGFEVEKAAVIYYVGQLSDFNPPRENYDRNQGIVFLGRISPEKGVHIILKALSLLKNSSCMKEVPITIIGPMTDKLYWQELQNLAKDLAPSIKVDFTGRLLHREMIKLLHRHSIFVFPVLWDEPFGIALLVAMAAGLSVVATSTGGSAEFLEDGKNCLVVKKGDVEGLADAIERLLGDKGLRSQLIKGGYETIKRFDFIQSIDLIEEHLYHVIAKQ